MRTRTVVKYARNLTPAEYSQCYRKNLGNGGTMRHTLAFAWKNANSNSKAVLIKDEHGDIIAWSLTHAEHMGQTGVMFWVEKPYRRQGYGTRLLRHSKKIDPQPRVFPHDTASGKFFKKHLAGVKVNSYDRYWLKDL